MTEHVLSFFPKEVGTARASQTATMQAIEESFASGKRIVILESPVGSGKSAMAMAFARQVGDAHVLTPRKSLQQQYFNDFPTNLSLMKGRSSYPCTYYSSSKAHSEVLKQISTGSIKAPARGEPNCSGAPCTRSSKIKEMCLSVKQRVCPYSEAMSVAQESDVIVHNVHSFIFQTSYGMAFGRRKLLVCDEVHTFEGILRGFASRTFRVPGLNLGDKLPNKGASAAEWIEVLGKPEFRPKNEEEAEYYAETLTKFRAQIDCFKKFVVKTEEDYATRATRLEFIPDSLGNLANSLIFDYGEKVLLMSGTIYNKVAFCRYLGINPESVAFIRTASTFPVKGRPIICKADYFSGTSFAKWDTDLKKTIANIKKILSIFHDAKGLIHAPSYAAAKELELAIADDRVVTHSPENFLERLDEFMEAEGNGVFISPVCSEGVDFKYDRARFQIIVRVPYPNAGDDFVEMKVKDDFAWFNYQSLLTFGQQLGRINRAPDDYGCTILLDERFPRYIQSNKTLIPKWVLDAIQWR